MLLSLFHWRDPPTRRAKKRARVSSSSTLTRLCFDSPMDQPGSSLANLNNVKKGGSPMDQPCSSLANLNNVKKGGVDISMYLPSGHSKSVVNKRLKSVAGDVYVLPVSPSRIRKFHLKFHVRRGTSDEKVVKEVINTNCYQRRCLKECLSDTKAKVWLDLGANIGTFSVLAAMHGSHVYALEPERENCIMARANIALNGLEDRITLFECGVVPPTHQGDIFNLHLCNGEKNKYRHTTMVTYPGRDRRRVKVHCSQLADIISSISKPITGIKMDIEGSEIGLLENLRDIPSSLKFLVFEYSFDFSRSVGRFHAIINRLRS